MIFWDVIFKQSSLVYFKVQWLTIRGVMVNTTAQFDSAKPKLRFCVGSICYGESLRQWSQLEIGKCERGTEKCWLKIMTSFSW